MEQGDLFALMETETEPVRERILPLADVARHLHRAGYLERPVTPEELINHRTVDGAVPYWGGYTLSNEVVREESFVFVQFLAPKAASNCASFLHRLAVRSTQTDDRTVRIHVRYFPGWHCDQTGRERRPRRRPRKTS